MEHSNGSNAAITSQNQDGSPGSYALRELIRDIPLSTDENGVQAHITCVDICNGSLYIGTSSGEVLHYVSIPPDPSAADDGSQPSYIFASKIEPPYVNKQEGADAGIKQILLLPSVDKACILCNGMLTFYTLPELSPAFGGKIKANGCLWVGGLDRDLQATQNGYGEDVVIVFCTLQRVRMIRIGRSAQAAGEIALGGLKAIERRGDLACVANGEQYSLLDLVNQRQNLLSQISSSADIKPLPELPQETPSHSRQSSKTVSSSSPARQSRSHERTTSVGGTSKNSQEPGAGSGSPWPARSSSHQVSPPPQPSSRAGSPSKDSNEAPDAASGGQEPAPDPVPPKPLLPHVVSPTAGEFFLTTGTTINDPGIGMFVNLDGDPARGTIEFSSYPESLALDGHTQLDATASPSVVPQEGYILAIVRRKTNSTRSKGIEIQRWDVDPGESHRTKEWLPLGAVEEPAEDDDDSAQIGLRNATSAAEVAVNDISTSLRLRRLRIKAATEQDETVESTRNREEDKFASRFSQVQANVLLFGERKVSWVLKNPLIMQLDQQFNSAVLTKTDGSLSIDVPSVRRVVNSVRGQEARDELEFLTLTYVRQKASLLLFGNLLIQAANKKSASEQDKHAVEQALVDGELDPRPILTLVPPLQEEIAEGPQGIWLPQGLRHVIQTVQAGFDPETLAHDTGGLYGDNILQVIKKYLLAWRKKKGFGSVADEVHVFRTVDAALLRVLLILDQHSPRGPAAAGTTRAELNSVVDGGVDCFDRAVALLEQFNRLYVLSRLYQSRKMVSQVLATWKRILEGEHDAGGELHDGEQVLRKYLGKISDSSLVQEYGAWLANRNPKLGVQVFADDRSRVQFQPAEAVSILTAQAPGAVKDYLEHLVFGKNHVQYVNDLITFYLDTVLRELEHSTESRAILVESYATYRALTPPKPTYRQFIADQAPLDAEWWHNRLRLLQLIGGSHGAASRYDVGTLGKRLAPYAAELVPEMIILHGREGRHSSALKLLVHGLGDYDTAIRYCLLGGSNIFHLRSGAAATAAGEPTEPVPGHDAQAVLFGHLLQEFFAIPDEDERLARAAELLERFGGWFDVAAVLDMVPAAWAVDRVEGFLTQALRALVHERRETEVVKALCGAQNLRRSVQFADVCEKAGATLVRDTAAAGDEVQADAG